MYTGKHLAAAQDVLVVTFNYRTNIFGFPGIPGSAQNLGFRDQRMAIEWVRDNIAGFGGDPEKIVVFGQSAGSIAIDLWSYAYKDDPIIKGFWAMSGNALTRPVSGPELVHDNFQLVSDAVNCTTASHQMACMREVDWEDLRNAASSLPSFTTDNPLRSWPAFSPSQDGELIFGDYASRSKKGRFAKIVSQPYSLATSPYPKADHPPNSQRSSATRTKKKATTSSHSSNAASNPP
jgi:cholinesterase